MIQRLHTRCSLLPVLLVTSLASASLLFHSDFELGETRLAGTAKPGQGKIRLVPNTGLSEWSDSGGIGVIREDGEEGHDFFQYTRRRKNVLQGVTGIDRSHPASKGVQTSGFGRWLFDKEFVEDKQEPGFTLESDSPIAGLFSARCNFSHPENPRVFHTFKNIESAAYFKFWVRFSSDFMAGPDMSMPVFDVAWDCFLLPEVQIVKQKAERYARLRMGWKEQLPASPGHGFGRVYADTAHAVRYHFRVSGQGSLFVSLYLDGVPVVELTDVLQDTVRHIPDFFFRIGKLRSKRLMGHMTFDNVSVSSTPRFLDTPGDHTALPVASHGNRILQWLLIALAVSLALAAGVMLGRKRAAKPAVAENAEEIVPLDIRGDQADRAAKIRDFILENYGNPISARDVASHFNMSLTWIGKIFSQATGKTITNYINEVRVARAKRLLEEPGLTVTQIGYKVGFNSLDYFLQVFRALEGTTPKEYRKGS